MADQTDSQRYTDQHPESIHTAIIMLLPNNTDPHNRDHMRMSTSAEHVFHGALLIQRHISKGHISGPAERCSFTGAPVRIALYQKQAELHLQIQVCLSISVDHLALGNPEGVCIKDDWPSDGHVCVAAQIQEAVFLRHPLDMCKGQRELRCALQDRIVLATCNPCHR